MDLSLEVCHHRLSQAASTLAHIGWTWKVATLVVNEWGMEIDLVQHPIRCIEHWVREALRWRLQNCIPQTRNDLGDRKSMVIDGQATFALHRSKRLDRKQKAYLASALVGGLHTRERLARADLAVCKATTCPYCGQANEDARHIFWHCRAYDK